MVYHEWTFHNTYIFFRDSSLKVCCMSFWIFLLIAKDPVFLSIQHRHDHSEWTEEWKLHSAQKFSPESEVLSAGKWTKSYDWPASLKCKSRLAVAQPQQNTSFWQTLYLPPGQMHAYVWKWPFYIIYSLFFASWFHHGAVQSIWVW